LAKEFGLGIEECLDKFTFRQALAAGKYIEEQYKTPKLSDFYTMQLTRTVSTLIEEVRRGVGTVSLKKQAKPREVPPLDDYKISFKTKNADGSLKGDASSLAGDSSTSSKDELKARESAVRTRMAWASRFAAAGIPVTHKTIPKPVSTEPHDANTTPQEKPQD
jgi:hypothetical protein